MARTFILVTDFVFHESAWLKEVASRNRKHGLQQYRASASARRSGRASLARSTVLKSKPPFVPGVVIQCRGDKYMGICGTG